MPLKLRITLGVMLLIAGFVVIRIGSTFKSDFQSANLALNSVMTPTPEPNSLTVDSDHDGLSDRDEIIWGTNPFNKDTDGDGYLDGEEIATGTDPLNPFEESPKKIDKGNLNTKTPNLTDRLLNLTTASLVDDSGNLNPDMMTQGRYADILQSINQEAMMFLIVPPPTDQEMKIIDDNSQKAVEKYLSTTASIIEEGLLSSTINATKEIGEISGVSSSYPSYYQKIYDSLKIMEVPSSWKEIHRSTMVTFKQLGNSFEVMKNTEEDPVKSSFALQQIQDSYLQLVNILNQSTRLAKSQNVKTQDSLFQMLESVNSLSSIK